jgi:hypothetical protein
MPFRVLLPVTFLAAMLALPTACGSENVAGGRSLESRADAVLEALYDRDWEAFAELVHPERGVLFSAYSFVDREEDVVLHRSALLEIPFVDTLYVWGREDGTGDAIEETPKTFIEERLLDRDFRDAERGARNQTLGSGNTVNNLPEVFHDAPRGQEPDQEIAFIEYHDAGTEAFGGMDWASLRIVFERVDGRWYVIGLVRDQWTI